MKLTKQEYEDFVKRYVWSYMQDPYYRIGQAFINDFPAYYRGMLDDGDNGQMDATKLWSSTDSKWCWDYIQRFVQE